MAETRSFAKGGVHHLGAGHTKQVVYSALVFIAKEGCLQHLPLRRQLSKIIGEVLGMGPDLALGKLSSGQMAPILMEVIDADAMA